MCEWGMSERLCEQFTAIDVRDNVFVYIEQLQQKGNRLCNSAGI